MCKLQIKLGFPLITCIWCFWINHLRHIDVTNKTFGKCIPWGMRNFLFLMALLIYSITLIITFGIEIVCKPYLKEKMISRFICQQDRGPHANEICGLI